MQIPQGFTFVLLCPLCYLQLVWWHSFQSYCPNLRHPSEVVLSIFPLTWQAKWCHSTMSYWPAGWPSNLRDVNGWIRRKLRCCRLKQRGRKYTTYKLLRSAGVSERKNWNLVIFGQGWWGMSRKVDVSRSTSTVTSK
jgi:hypothetical protein